VTLSGYLGIAIDNSALYRSLARKVEEYERLKELARISSNPSTSESWRRSGGSRRELELAAREAHATPANTRSDASSRNCGRRICASSFPREAQRVHNVYKYLLKEKDATLTCGRPADRARRPADRRLIIFGRHHRS